MAVSPLKPFPVRSMPGIKRDGTQFDGPNYLDGLWMRFQRGLPRKMGGYRMVTSTLDEKVYGMRVDGVNQNVYAHLGSEAQVRQVVTDFNGVFSANNDRTPVGFSGDDNFVWQMDAFYDSGAGTQQLIAHAGANLASIANETEYDIYAGDLTAGGALVATGMDPVSGGVVAVGAYLMAYGTNGRVDWTAANDFSATVDSAFVSGSKIVKGLSLRGTGSGPGAILWSLDSVIRAQFLDPTVVTFGFDTLGGESSILSSQGVIEYDGIYYWAGVDRFLMFNGVVREIQNNMNVNWFFDNLNFTQRQKVFAYKVPRFGEIWWCFPYGNATECTHAVIYNVRENSWYDTRLPANFRTAGTYPRVYQKPFMCDGEVDSGTDKYTLWQHETGTDEVFGASVNAIQSYFRTSEVSVIDAPGGAADMGFRIGRTEPDFVQTGNMTVTVVGRANAKSQFAPGETFTILETPSPTDPQTQVVNMKESWRILSFIFESNVAGGDYQMGQTLAFMEPQEARFTGG